MSQQVRAAHGGKNWLRNFHGTPAIAATAVLLGSLGFYLGIVAQQADSQSSGSANMVAASTQAANFATPTLTAVAQQSAQAAPAYIDTVTDSASASPFGAAPKMTNAYLDQHGKADLPKAIRAGLNTNMEMPEDFVPSNADGNTHNAPFASINLPENVSGARAIQLLGADLSKIAAWYGMTPEAFSDLLMSDRSIQIDRKGRVVHMDA
jgi:hypothetical protein